MPKKSVNIVFYGNCQAIGLCHIYKRYVRHETGLNPIFIDVTSSTEQDRETVKHARAVVFQVFDHSGWLTEDDINPSATVVRFPSFNAGFLWPYGSREHIRNESLPFFPHGPYPANIGDSYLNRAIQRQVPFDEAIAEYMALDVAKAAHLDRLFEMSMERQRRRDRQAGIDVADFIEDRFREEQLFLTPDHPSLNMFTFVAKKVLDQLGIKDSLAANALASVHRAPFPRTEAPVHPKVAEHFGLNWANESRRYTFWDEGSYTFREFAFNYMDCRWNQDLARVLGEADLTLTERLEVVDRALIASPRSCAGLLKKGECLLAMKRLEEAEQWLRRAIAVDPQEIRAHQTLAKVLVSMGQCRAAVVAAQNAIEVFPEEATSYAVLSEVLARGGQSKNALARAEEAVRLAPGDAGLLVCISRVLLSAGAPVKAARLARKASKLEPGRFWRSLIGPQLRRLRRWKTHFEGRVNSPMWKSVVARLGDRNGYRAGGAKS